MVLVGRELRPISLPFSYKYMRYYYPSLGMLNVRGLESLYGSKRASTHSLPHFVKDCKPHFDLFPDEDILTKEIESWKGFEDKLPDEDRDLSRCSTDVTNILNLKEGRPFPTELVIMAPLYE